MFDLTRPCVDCPFRRGQGSAYELHPERLAEIRRAVAFQCHKTVDYDSGEPDEEGEVTPGPGTRPQQCAGLMSVLHHADEPNQIMQVAIRLGVLDPTRLDPRKEAYQSWAEAIAAHCEGREPDAVASSDQG